MVASLGTVATASVIEARAVAATPGGERGALGRAGGADRVAPRGAERHEDARTEGGTGRPARAGVVSRAAMSIRATGVGVHLGEERPAVVRVLRRTARRSACVAGWSREESPPSPTKSPGRNSTGGSTRSCGH